MAHLSPQVSTFWELLLLYSQVAGMPLSEHLPHCGKVSKICLRLLVMSLWPEELTVPPPYVPSTNIRDTVGFQVTKMITEWTMFFYPFQGTWIQKKNPKTIKSFNIHTLNYYYAPGTDLNTRDVTVGERVSPSPQGVGIQDKHNPRKSLQMPWGIQSWERG